MNIFSYDNVEKLSKKFELNSPQAELKIEVSYKKENISQFSTNALRYKSTYSAGKHHVLGKIA